MISQKEFLSFLPFLKSEHDLIALKFLYRVLKCNPPEIVETPFIPSDYVDVLMEIYYENDDKKTKLYLSYLFSYLIMKEIPPITFITICSIHSELLDFHYKKIHLYVCKSLENMMENFTQLQINYILMKTDLIKKTTNLLADSKNLDLVTCILSFLLPFSNPQNSFLFIDYGVFKNIKVIFESNLNDDSSENFRINGLLILNSCINNSNDIQHLINIGMMPILKELCNQDIFFECKDFLYTIIMTLMQRVSEKQVEYLSSINYFEWLIEELKYQAKEKNIANIEFILVSLLIFILKFTNRKVYIQYLIDIDFKSVLIEARKLGRSEMLEVFLKEMDKFQEY